MAGDQTCAAAFNIFLKLSETNQTALPQEHCDHNSMTEIKHRHNLITNTGRRLYSATNLAGITSHTLGTLAQHRSSLMPAALELELT
jgi:hypothetical protein